METRQFSRAAIMAAAAAPCATTPCATTPCATTPCATTPGAAVLCAAAFCAAALCGAALGATAAQAAPPTVTRPVNDLQTVTLAGNTRPEANPANDRGALPAETPLAHMELLLKRPPATQAALDAYVERLTDRRSPDYHRWLTAEALGTDFGPAAFDIAAVTHWLGGHGFTVNGMSKSRMTIDFSGTAGEVAQAFHTSLHVIQANGATHIANMTDPRIPAALSGVVAGIVSLNDFRPRPMFKPRPAYTATLDGSTFDIVAPADLATIYDFNPTFQAGTTGAGQTIVVIEDTNVYKTADWTSFRAAFGLSGYTAGSFTQIHPAGSNACANPGTVPGPEAEAELDAEWASAAAPSAAIVLASCADTATSFGGLLALQNLLDSASPPGIVSISYGECEPENGATQNAAYEATYEQAVALGVSVFVSAGDEGAASCDADQPNATHGISVSGFASTPYNVAVGGTDFGDTYAGKNSAYWSNRNTSTYGSAKSYIPEIPWNDSCASVLIATAAGYSTPYGSSGFCNSALGQADYVTTASGSGGPSGCATGAPSIAGVVSGTCRGYTKPAWQSVFGNPADKRRDLPDVSLFAANGVWAHFYVYCDSDVADGGAACTGAPVNWSGAGGTSFASPILAGIQALVNQKTGSRQGNPNPTYYALAATEYGASGSTLCNSSRGRAVGAACIFYDVREGDMDVNCTGTHDCYDPSGTYGVLSTNDTRDLAAYATRPGWDFATGIGTVNVTNLVDQW
jgi:subtilase family serine protease